MLGGSIHHFTESLWYSGRGFPYYMRNRRWLDTDEVQLESFSLNNRRWQTEESEDEDASLTSKKPRYDHDFILMNV